MLRILKRPGVLGGLLLRSRLLFSSTLTVEDLRRAEALIEKGHLEEALKMQSADDEKALASLFAQSQGERFLGGLLANSLVKAGRVEEGAVRMRVLVEHYRQEIPRTDWAELDDSQKMMVAFPGVLYSTVLFMLGRTQEAHRMFAEGIENMERAFGKHDERVVEEYGRLAEMMRQQRDEARALEYGQTFASRTAQLKGDSHPETLQAKLRVAQTRNVLDRGQDTEHNLANMRAVVEAAEAEGQKETLAKGQRLLASTLFVRGKHEEALQIYSRLVPLSVEVFGANDYFTVEVQAQLGVLLGTLGRHDEALGVLRGVREASQKDAYFKTRYDVMVARQQLARSAAARDQLSEAIEVLVEMEQHLDEEMARVGEHDQLHPGLLDIKTSNLVDLGMLLFRQALLEDALLRLESAKTLL